MSEEDETWTWIDKYGTRMRPTLPRLCMKCGYKGYFKLQEIETSIPTFLNMHWTLMGVCPKCGNEIEIKESDRIEMLFIPSKRMNEIVKKYAKKWGKKPEEALDELTDIALKNIIFEFNPKTGKVRLIRKDTGEEISFG